MNKEINHMIINFAEGIQITIDEEKVIEWRQEEKKVYVSVGNDNGGCDDYVFDLNKKTAKKF